MAQLNEYLALGVGDSDKTVETTFPIANQDELEALLEVAFERLNQQSEMVWLLAYFDTNLTWAVYRDNRLETSPSLSLDPAELQELRLFGASGEYYLWRSGTGVFNSRLRLEQAASTGPNFKNKSEEDGFEPSEAHQPSYAEEWQVLWGTKVAQNLSQPGWTTIEEVGRGVEYAIPHLVNTAQLPLRLRIRHYLNYDAALGLASYGDMRLVELCDSKFKPLKRGN